jgi:hypothetical protein
MPDPINPNLSSMVQPGTASGPMPAPDNSVTSGGAPIQAPDVPNTPLANQTAPNPNAINPANAPAAPAAPVKHAVLLKMVTSLADGLSAAGASFATHGREGGAGMVQQLEGQRAEQQQRAVAATQAQKDAELRNKLTTAQTNQANINNHILTATMPDEISLSHMKVPEAQTKLAGEQQGQAITGADFQAQHGGMKPDEFSQALSSTSPVSGGVSTGVNPFFVSQANSVLRAAKTARLPDDNPMVQKLQAVLADSKSTPKDVFLATGQLAGEQDRQGKAIDQRVKQDAAIANDPVSKLSTPEALSAPGSQAAIQAKIDDPTTAPADVSRLHALLPQAAVAQLNAETIKAREARTQQIVNQGDPTEAGRLLADRSLTLSELKSRQVTPKFIADAVLAAQKVDPTFKAAESEAQGRIAASPANSQFFGNTDSLLVNGGTLDQLNKAYASLGNTKIPIINKLDNLRKAAVGSGPLAAAYAAQLGVADDYSKVMSGGTGSDTSRQQALDILSVNLSPEARPAAISQIRQAVTSQRNGRVGTNPYMKDMYPDPSTRQEAAGKSGTQQASPTGATHVVPGPDGKNHYTNAAGTVDLGVAP